MVDFDEVVLCWISMICWFGKCGGQVLQWMCFCLTGMYVFSSMVGLNVDLASQWIRVDLSRDMSQLQLQGVRVYVQGGAPGSLNMKEQHGQQIKSRKAFFGETGVFKEASPVVMAK